MVGGEVVGVGKRWQALYEGGQCGLGVVGLWSGLGD
jgi:hypothetical protein